MLDELFQSQTLLIEVLALNMRSNAHHVNRKLIGKKARFFHKNPLKGPHFMSLLPTCDSFYFFNTLPQLIIITKKPLHLFHLTLITIPCCSISPTQHQKGVASWTSVFNPEQLTSSRLLQASSLKHEPCFPFLLHPKKLRTI